MPCYHPLTGYRSKYVNPSGKRSIVFKVSDGYSDMPVTVPCGRCIGCRLEHSRQWALRCLHESSLHQDNSFITLTYSNDHVPDDFSIRKTELQKFFKRLRKALNDKKIRYFACGEYGDETHRPHYHAIIFGHDFPDKVPWKEVNGHILYTSPFLEKVWGKGYAPIGNVTFESAAYVARYVMKKHKGDEHEKIKHYQAVCENTGEIYNREPEFCLMSRNPGLGKNWLEMYTSDTDKDFVTLRGKKMKLPKYYDNILEVKNSQEMETRKATRRRKAKQNEDDNTYERLLVKEKVKTAQINQLKRNLQHET